MLPQLILVLECNDDGRGLASNDRVSVPIPRCRGDVHDHGALTILTPGAGLLEEVKNPAPRRVGSDRLSPHWHQIRRRKDYVGAPRFPGARHVAQNKNTKL